MEHYEFVDKRFDELNEMNSKGHDYFDYEKPVEKLAYPADVSNKENYLGFQEVSLWFATDEKQGKEDIIEYFTKLGKHLAENQDGVYVTMVTDDLGIDTIHLGFPKYG